MAKILMLILLSSFIGGCAVFTFVTALYTTTDVFLLQNQRTYPVRTPAEHIEVFKKKPDTTFVQVALVDYSSESFEVEPFTFFESDDDVIKALKKKASDMGGMP